jgi:ribosome-associated toxin RatA of RatAB toxin-antitoxin module
MARYVTTIASPWSAAQAFEFVADLRNFEKWDDTVSSSTLIDGDEPALGATFRVKVMAAELDYVITEYERPSRAVAEATTRLLHSYDVIEIAETDDGCEVTYDATLELRSVFGIANPLVGLFFDRIGTSASKGLATALGGTKIR